MRYAVNVPNFGDFGDPATLVSLAVEAEQSGWDGFFVWDHLQGMWDLAADLCDPWVALGAVAQATSSIRIGTMVTPLPRRRPAKVARETATLDVVSGGRLILGVGIGSPPDADFANFGDVADAGVRGAMLDEGLDVLTGLWTGEPFSHAGAHYRVERAVFRPVPVQRPRIPIWVAGALPHRAPFRRAARWDGVFPLREGEGPGDYRPLEPDELERVVAYVAERRSGDAAFDVVASGSTASEPDGARTVAAYGAAGATWWMEHLGFPGRPLDSDRARIRAGPPRPG